MNHLEIKDIEGKICKIACDYYKYKNDPQNKSLAQSSYSELMMYYQSRSNEYSEVYNEREEYSRYVYYAVKKKIENKGLNRVVFQAEDIIADVFFKSVRSYEVEKNDSFCAYFFSMIRYHILDLAKKAGNLEPGNQGDADDIFKDETTEYSMDIIEKNSIASYFEQLKSYLEVSRFKQHFGSDRNGTRRYLLNLWTTGSSTAAVRAFPVLAKMVNQNEFFMALDLDFLDYFMSEKCRSVLELITVNLRKRGEIDPQCKGNKDDMVEIPLKPYVYMCFMNSIGGSVSAGTISTNFKDFENLFRKIAEVRKKV